MTTPDFKGWLSHGWGIEVDNPHQLFRIISRIALLKRGRTYAWRGQNDASWDLSSSLYRLVKSASPDVEEDHLRSRELEIIEEARRWGLGRDLGSSATDLHLLAILQHHGVPTRLIDVTANPMTALWFAAEEHKQDEHGESPKTSGVLFAIDVTDTPWCETFYFNDPTWKTVLNPLGGAYEAILEQSKEKEQLFRVFSALPDDRMRAQEGFFIGSAIPAKHRAAGVRGFNPTGLKPGSEKLRRMLNTQEGPGRPANLPFCAIIIPNSVKEKIRDPLKRTYNRRRRVLFPDVDGFREAFLRDQLD
ncbi:FRG domain-containing protein [Glycomyces terrestris]|uniref:FRG domain-containing protein n=1 Tax=Glycomyces terrestris TaxID=2493553 RepID=A0A426UZZ0_9ACTN|nr:FRG domain-containing protein [Glycomyces terrestris]RRS00180.1 FRG domain-containing protein [Glycomyces terrestris]